MPPPAGDGPVYARTTTRRRAVASLLGMPIAAFGLARVAWAASDDPAIPASGGFISDWMPMEMPDHRRLIVSGRINGKPALLMIDSGAGSLVIDRKVVATESFGELHAIDMTGTAQGYRGSSVQISIGNAGFEVTRTAVFDLSNLNAALPHPVDAIIGGELFQRFAIDIDFQNTRMRIISSTAPPRFGIDMPLTFQAHGLPTAMVQVEGRAPIPALVDLGADRALYLSPTYARDEGLLTGRRTATSVSAGVSGLRECTVAVLRDLDVGQRTFNTIPTEIPQDWSLDVPAIVGLPVWRRFERVAIDVPHSTMCLSQQDSTSPPPFRKDRSGLGVVLNQDRLQIIHVAKGSPADVAGIHVGDAIVAINGQRCSRTYLAAHGRDGAQPAGTIQHLALLDGRKVKLVLDDYF